MTEGKHRSLERSSWETCRIVTGAPSGRFATVRRAGLSSRRDVNCSGQAKRHCARLRKACGADAGWRRQQLRDRRKGPISSLHCFRFGVGGAGFLDPVQFTPARLGFDRPSGVPGGRDRRRGAVACSAAQCLGMRGSSNAPARHANLLKTIRPMA